MKRLFTLFAFASAIATGQAQNVTDKPVILRVSTFSYIPSYLSHDGKTYLVAEDYYNGSLSVYDDNLNVIKSLKNEDRGIAALVLQDFDSFSATAQGDGIWLDLSQTLFNNDAKYEYVIRTKKLVHWTIDGETCSGELYSGFKIVNEDGKVLQEIHAPFEITKEKDFEVEDIIKFNDKYFIHVLSYNEEYLYPINRNTADGISPVGAPVKISASPSLARRGQTVTVELDEDATRERTVTVTNAAGQRVWRGTAKQGQKTVNLSTDRLSHGVNIVNVEGESARSSCKVIVR